MSAVCRNFTIRDKDINKTHRLTNTCRCTLALKSSESSHCSVTVDKIVKKLLIFFKATALSYKSQICRPPILVMIIGTCCLYRYWPNCFHTDLYGEMYLMSTTNGSKEKFVLIPGDTRWNGVIVAHCADHMWRQAWLEWPTGVSLHLSSCQSHSADPNVYSGLLSLQRSMSCVS